MAGIYIHIPFCKQACHYCDFHFSISFKKKDDLINSLRKELQFRKEELANQKVETIYFGGGTPSLLNVDELQLMIEEVYKNYDVVDIPEITLEANPDDLTKEQINKLSDTPINRLSIGIQSVFDDDLKAMNRAHNSVEAKKCLEEASKHFDNITIDLIYGIPNMNLKKWNQNLQITFDFEVPHISSYALTVEPKTALDSFISKGKYPPLNESLALQHFNHLVSEAENNGFVQYEISNFGKPEYFSKHNSSYWQGKHYLGIGPSAHSFNGKQRSWNVSNNTKYIKAINNENLPLEVETLSLNDRFNEYIMTGLRTIWGVSIEHVEKEFGLNYKNHLLTSAKRFIDNGQLVISSDRGKSHNLGVLKATQQGKFLIDGIASQMFMI